MLCTSIFLSNLPFGISAAELIKELIEIFGEVFQQPHNDGNLNVRLFHPSAVTQRSAINQKAVVSGFSTDFELLILKGYGKKIRGKYDISMKMDHGDARTDDGEFSKKLTAAERRARNRLMGETDRKIMILFKSSFLKEINHKVFSGSSSTIHFGSDEICIRMLNDAGQLLACHPLKGKQTIRIEFVTQLEALQGIVYLNKNEAFCSQSRAFCDAGKCNFSTFSKCTGIGINGSLLDVNAECAEMGYIALNKLDGGLVDWNRLQDMKSYCWRCKLSFKIKGIDSRLNFVAAVCSCSYDRSLDILDKKRAFFWPGQGFTKLTLGQSKGPLGSYDSFIIFHNPMKVAYESPEEYRNVVAPVLFEEWKYYSEGFKIANSCKGGLDVFEFVERLEISATKSVNVYCVQISVPKTKFWALGASQIRKLKLTLKLLKEMGYLKEVEQQWDVKGIVKKMEEDSCCASKLRLFVQIKLPLRSKPMLNQHVTVIPKPNKTEYAGTKQTINNWLNNPFSSFSVFLNENQSWEITNGRDMKSLGPLNYPVYKMIDSLNKEQLESVKKANVSSLSLIQGPPGTGKTLTSSIIAIHNSVVEHGFVLACTPSNFAADGLAASISLNSAKFKLPRKVLRIYSKSREEELSRRFEPKGVNSGVFDLLHEEIRKSPKWMKDESLLTIIKKLESANDHLLTKSEIDAFDAHVQQLEKETMAGYDVFVSTVGALADKRVAGWSKHHQISTVVIDEAGQLTHPASLSLFLFNQTRTIIVGDHKQLQPLVNSYSAETAGLGLSVMEWIEMSPHTVPWTILKEQYRMAPSICRIVSNVTYEGQLRNASNVIHRPLEITDTIYVAIPQLAKHNVVVFDHRYPELQVESSFMNNWEVKKTLEIVESLLKNKVPLSKVAILTLYDAQKEAITAELNNKLGLNTKDITVSNVDAYQGRENSLVILNFVRSNDQRAIGFSSTPNRLNVAISRAKFFLLILCNIYNFEGHRNKSWTSFLGELKKEAEIIADY